MIYTLYIQAHVQATGRIIKEFRQIAHVNCLFLRSEVYVSPSKEGSYFNLYFENARNLGQVKIVWRCILELLSQDRKFVKEVRKKFIARVFRENKNSEFVDELTLNDYVFPESKKIAHNFLSSSFSWAQHFEKIKRQIEENNGFGDFEEFELMVRIPNKIKNNVISYIKQCALKFESSFDSIVFSKKDNYTKLFLRTNSLKTVKNVWRDLKSKAEDENSLISSYAKKWAVLVYLDRCENDYILLADPDLNVEEKSAIANNFLEDSFSWEIYINNFPEVMVDRKHDLRIRTNEKINKTFITEFKKMVLSKGLVFGVSIDDYDKSITDFYIIGYSNQSMQNIWDAILAKTNDNSSFFSILKKMWIVEIWQSNKEYLSIELANSEKISSKIPSFENRI